MYVEKDRAMNASNNPYRDIQSDVTTMTFCMLQHQSNPNCVLSCLREHCAVPYASGTNRMISALPSSSLDSSHRIYMPVQAMYDKRDIGTRCNKTSSYHRTLRT